MEVMKKSEIAEEELKWDMSRLYQTELDYEGFTKM